MKKRGFVVRIMVPALALVAGASASLSAISNLAPDDQADGAQTNASYPSNWTEPAATVVEVTIPPSSPAATAKRELSANPLWAMPISQFSVTRERPIFSPSRRPPPAVAVTAVTPKFVNVPKPKEPERPQLSLVGTILGDQEKYGIFVEQVTKAVVRLKVGEEFQGWKVGSIQGREASLEKSPSVFVLEMPPPGLSQPTVAVRQEASPLRSDESKLTPYAPRARRDR